MSTGKVLLGLLAGVATGATLGILFAPEKGSKTRKKISKKSEDYEDALNEKFNEFIESISEKFEEVKDKITDVAEETMQKSKEAVKDVKTDKS